MNVNLKDERYEVTPIELFFDLIYAFALSQITGFLILDISWIAVLKAVILLSAIYMVWAYTSWSTTMIHAELKNSKKMLLAVMVFGFFMNISVEKAFSGNGIIFVITYLLIQFGRNFWTLKHSPTKEYKEHFKYVIIWQIVSTPFWIAGIYFFNNVRINIWLVAVLIDLLGTWLGHPIPSKKLSSENAPFDAEHLLERCRLFRLIALGEMIFSTGDAIKESNLSLMTVFLVCISMAEIISLWMLSFGRFVKIVAKHRKQSTNPMLMSRYAITVLGFILIGIIFITVGMKYVILHPYAILPKTLVLLMGMGPVIFLLAQGWYLYKVPKIYPILYISGGILLFISSVIGFYFKAWVYHILLGSILVIIAYIDFKSENGVK